MSECVEITRKENSWFLISDFKDERLFTKREVAKIIKNTKFLNKSLELKKEGIFTLDFFIESSYVGDKKNSELKRKRELWTQKGVDYLKNLYLVNSQEGSRMAELFHYVADTIGQNNMFSQITKKHNRKNPDKPWSEVGTRSFMLTQWYDFSKKSKEKFILCTDYLVEIKNDIEKNIIPSELIIDHTTDFSDYTNMSFV